MPKKVSILCFGDSLTSGYYGHGLESNPYARNLKRCLQAEFRNTDISVDVDGLPGDLVISPPGVFLSRIQEKYAEKHYDWMIILGGTKYDLPLFLSLDDLYVFA
jgi:lysophospholipase L1-like esterase